MAEVRAFYDLSQDMYVVEFVGDPIFSVSDEEYDWGMFTHGVCTDVVKHLRFTRIGITGRHLCSEEPTPESLGERLDLAILRLSSNYESRPFDMPVSMSMLRCQKGAEILSKHRTQIIQNLIASWYELAAGA
jgi:hypothetical protein